MYLTPVEEHAALVREHAVQNTMCTHHLFHIPVVAVSSRGASYRQNRQLTAASSRTRVEFSPSVCTCRSERRRGTHCPVGLGLSPHSQHPHITATATQTTVQKHPHLPLAGIAFLSSSSQALSQSCSKTSTTSFQASP